MYVLDEVREARQGCTSPSFHKEYVGLPIRGMATILVYAQQCIKKIMPSAELCIAEAEKAALQGQFDHPAEHYQVPTEPPTPFQ